MSWQVLIGLSIVLEAFGRITQRVLLKGKESDPIVLAIVYQLIGGILLGCIAVFAGFTLPNLQPLLLNIAAAPIFWGLANIFVFKSLQSTEASVFTILFASRTFWMIILAIVVLGEAFSVQQSVGALFILAAVVLVSWKKQTLQLRKGELFALIGAACFALGSVNDAYIVRTVPAFPYLAYNFFASGLFIWCVNPSATKRIFALSRQQAIARNAILLAMLLVGSASTALIAYQVGRNAAQLSAIFPVANILVVVLAIFLLKERSHLMAKLIAVALSVVGIVLVS